MWLNAKQVKVRDHGRVVSEAVVVAYAVHQSGVREVIGLDLAAGARVQLLCLLAQGPRSVKDLASAAGIEQPAASQHLRVLRNLGFVRAQKKGRHKIYELYDSHVAGVLEQAIAHAEHLRDHLSLCAGEESVVAGSRRREALGRAS